MKNKVKNKKGFTLAELLVVLAIMAVLVAVAVPLFMGAVGDANQTAIDANVRSIRSAALIAVNEDPTLAASTTGWHAECEIFDDGTMGDVTVTAGTVASETIPTSPAGNYIVNVEEVEINP